jgi:signal transduction histidine kinase
MANKSFTVDTHLFRELGELLVSRNSTALVELIKNAYDADATRVTIDGRNLNDPVNGQIVVTDDGVGMNAGQFESGFLSIASRFKDSESRKSIKFGRRYTGAKGIGRLAAHKLARLLEVESFPDAIHSSVDRAGVRASINWQVIEDTLTFFSDIQASGAVVVDTIARRRSTKPGTTITLRNLRKKWSSKELLEFKAEVEGFQPSPILLELPRDILQGDPAFDRPNIADVDAAAPGMTCELTGDFETGDEYWTQVVTTAQWILEVDASSRCDGILIRITPTRSGVTEFPAAEQKDFRIPHPDHSVGPHFHARILIREGGRGNRTFKQWSEKSYGIRIYNEGFRVLPYGEPSNDWLSIDEDYKTRAKSLRWLDEQGLELDRPDNDENEALVFLGNSAYFGAAFLTTAGAPRLKMVVSREGFVADPSLDHMTEILRTAIYLSVRVRAAAKRSIREERRDSRQANSRSRLESGNTVKKNVESATQLAREAKRQAALGDFAGAAIRIDEAANRLTEGAEVSERLMTEGATLRVLASVGTQMAAFVHEMNGILGMVRSLETAVSEIDQSLLGSLGDRKRLKQLLVAIGELRRGIERQASYLTDVVSPDARRRRSRLKLADRFQTACRLVSAVAARNGIEIDNLIPEDLRSPPMFASELTVVFANLLTNAIKAAGIDGRVRASGTTDSTGDVTIIVENTGQEVSLESSEKWFKPFESTTLTSDPVLGQGMGMGLPITRNLLEDYGASVVFCTPSSGFRTALRLQFPR